MVFVEGWAKFLASDLLEIYSGGTKKYPVVKPKAIELMSFAKHVI